jgi:hypothetical protein
MNDSPWDKYQLMQAELRTTYTVGNRSWAVEDAMNHIAEAGLTHQTPANDDYVDRVISTTQRRERHRAALRRLYLVEDHAGPHPEEQLDARAALRSARAKVSKSDWDLLCAVAVGRSYAEMAARRGTTAGALRVHVSRLRHDELGMPDYTTRIGAEQLAAMIRQHWAALGHVGARVWLEPTRAAGWVLRSNLDRGLPPHAAP